MLNYYVKILTYHLIILTDFEYFNNVSVSGVVSLLRQFTQVL